MEREQLIAWAAGFFDGEGSVGLFRARMGGKVMTLRVRVGQRFPEPLMRFVLLWGGAVRHRPTKPGQGEFYEWAKSSHPAYEALLEMEPYLTVKLPHVQLARDFMSGVGRRGDMLLPGRGNQGLTSEESARRDALKEAMSILNQRGVLK